MTTPGAGAGPKGGDGRGVRIERVVTSGTFSLDGGTWEVDNNVWLVGDDEEVVVIDAAHDAAPIVAAIDGRRVTAIILTHGHNDHINAAGALRDATKAPIWLSASDRMLWAAEYPELEPDHDLTDGTTFDVAKTTLVSLHTPGHSPGSMSLYAEKLGAVFTGDTLFHGGPGATGRSYSDKPTILASIRNRLLALPGETVVHTGHGDTTTITAEAANIS
jgi:glyoxylase-like metal-dependent hydrolase (beta-lactamase superfamily II)